MLAASAIIEWLPVAQQSPIETAQTNSVGGAPRRLDTSDIGTIRLRFESGSRSEFLGLSALLAAGVMLHR